MKVQKHLPNPSFIKYCTIVVLPVIFLVSFTACAVKMPAMTAGTIDKFALMSTTVNFVTQTGIGGPAIAARTQFNNRSEEINNLMTYFVDSLHQAVADNLKTQLGCEVLYGNELHAIPGYSVLKKEYERADALNKEDEHFPEVVISSGDFNFFVAETKKGIIAHGGETTPIAPEELQAAIPDICKELGVQYVGVAEFVLSGYKDVIFLAPTTYVIYRFLLYDHFGELIASGSFTNRTDKIIESDMSGSYENMIRAYLYNPQYFEIHAVSVKKKK